MAEVEAALVAAKALQDQEAAVAAAATVKEQGSVSGSKPIPAGVIANISYGSSSAILEVGGPQLVLLYVAKHYKFDTWSVLVSFPQHFVHKAITPS